MPRQWTEKQREKQKAYTRERYQWLKEHHICTKCGKADAEPGKVKCVACAEATNRNRRTAYAARNRDSEINRAMVKYNERKEQGICVVCGIRYSEIGRVRCKICRDRINARRHERDPDGSIRAQKKAEYKQRLKEQGLCLLCGKRKPMEGKKRCQKCSDRDRDYRIRDRYRRQWAHEKGHEYKAVTPTCRA